MKLIIAAFLLFPALAQAASKFEFNTTPECGLRKFVNDEWVSSSDAVSGALELKPSKNDPEYSMFKHNGAWY